jgi:hypothetical protein
MLHLLHLLGGVATCESIWLFCAAAVKRIISLASAMAVLQLDAVSCTSSTLAM